jgi:O-antigen ligase
VTAIIFLLLFAGGLGLCIFRHPIYGLYTYVAVFYLHPPSRWWAASLPDLRWSYMAALVTLLATLALARDDTRPQWYSTTAGKLLIAFTLWVWIQFPWALSKEDHQYFAVLYVKYLVVFYLIYRLLDSRERVVEFLLVHVAGCLYLGWVALGVRYTGRLNGVGGPGIDEANLLAAQIATGVVIAAMLLLSEKKWRRALCFLALPLMLNIMVMAGSRGAFLSMVGAGLVLWYFKPRAYTKAFYVYAIVGLIAVGAVTNDAFWERMTTIGAAAESYDQADESAQNRMVAFKAQFQMAKSWPHGSGHRGTAVLSPQYMEAKWLSKSDNPQRASHNTLMTAWVEQGLPGLFFYVAFFLLIVRTLMQRRAVRKSEDAAHWNVVFAAVGAGFTVLYIAGQFVDVAKAEIYIWLLAAMAASSELVRRKTETADAKQPKPKHGAVRGKAVAGPSAAAGARGSPARRTPAS